MPGKIIKLSENVINKIAAGEIITDPAASNYWLPWCKFSCERNDGK